MARARDKIRIGGVPYRVGGPLVTGLEADPAVELTLEAPAAMVRPLREGELDAALVSSIEAFRRPGYRAVPGVAICCRGPVHSVRAFVRRGTTIADVGLDVASETSVALLRILLERRLGVTGCTFTRIRSTRQPDRLPHDLVMMIGDDGLHADPGGREVIDLGAAWHEWTGLPFVFALWLIAPDAPAEPIVEKLLNARERAGPPRGPCDDGVYYDFGPSEAAGLERFRSEAVAMGLAEPDTRPQWVGTGRGSGREIRNDSQPG